MSTPITAGPAFRVTLLGEPQSEAYQGVFVQLDATHRVAHVFSADETIHYLTVPLDRALIEWTDPAPLEPQPRLPPYGPGAFERMGEQVQRMVEGMGRTMGPG